MIRRSSLTLTCSAIHAKSHILTFIGTPIVPRVFSIAMLFVLRQCEAPNLMLSGGGGLLQISH